MKLSFDFQPGKPLKIIIPGIIIIVTAGIMLTGCSRDMKSLPAINGNDLASITLKGKSSKPNILILLGDDIGYEVPTCDGGESYQTPNIDKMAKNGVLFTQCHSAPTCSPSRFMLLTGKYNFRNYSKWGVMGTDNRTIGNMLKDAGYATCYTGKWQLDGGDNSIRTFGWDRYSVWYPFDLDKEKLEGSRYKSSKIYQDGGYLPLEASLDKWSDDIFTSYLLNFIDSTNSIKQPFLAYYSMNMIHGPISPTPDDPEYATWDFANLAQDPAFFASNIKYVDKKIGEIRDHLDALGLLENTIIFFLADNGTQPRVKSQFNGFTVQGGKGSTDEIGTNVPLVVLWKGKLVEGSVSNTVVDFTDFMPTIAEAAGIPTPTNYGTLDGVSFYPAILSGTDLIIQSTLYDAYSKSPIGGHPFRTWVQDDTYKLYGKGTFQGARTFVKIAKGKSDKPPIADSSLTPEQVIIKANFQAILDSYPANP